MAAKSRGENFVPIYNFLVTACTGAVHGNWSGGRMEFTGNRG